MTTDPTRAAEIVAKLRNYKPYQFTNGEPFGPAICEDAADFIEALLQRPTDTARGSCDHEWVNEACDGNHYNCQHCPATFIYDRNIDKEPATAEQAVAAERERCAKIAENHFADERALGVVNALYMSTSIAAAIRQSAKGGE